MTEPMNPPPREQYTAEQLEDLKHSAGLSHRPTQLTARMRLGVAGQGPEAHNWSDKPHRLVYDLCNHIERQAALAPDLLEVLQAIAGESVFNQMRFDGEDATDYFLRSFRAVKERARAAIAQAEGTAA